MNLGRLERLKPIENPDDEDALASVTVGVPVFQDVEKITALDLEDAMDEHDLPGT